MNPPLFVRYPYPTRCGYPEHEGGLKSALTFFDREIKETLKTTGLILGEGNVIMEGNIEKPYP